MNSTLDFIHVFSRRAHCITNCIVHPMHLASKPFRMVMYPKGATDDTQLQYCNEKCFGNMNLQVGIGSERRANLVSGFRPDLPLDQCKARRRTVNSERCVMQDVESRAGSRSEAREALSGLVLGKRRQVVIDRANHAATAVVNYEGPFAPEAQIYIAMRLEQAGQAPERLDHVLVPMLAWVAEGSVMNRRDTSIAAIARSLTPLKELQHRLPSAAGVPRQSAPKTKRFPRLSDLRFRFASCPSMQTALSD